MTDGQDNHTRSFSDHYEMEERNDPDTLFKFSISEKNQALNGFLTINQCVFSLSIYLKKFLQGDEYRSGKGVKIFLTAGVAALLVRGNSCFPAPPPNMIEATFFGSALGLGNTGAFTV